MRKITSRLSCLFLTLCLPLAIPANVRAQYIITESGSPYRTATGYEALVSNTTGLYNTANGYQVLFSNTTGNSNTANGYRALFSNTTGNSNTANGYRALYANTTGANNTANGYRALLLNTTGSFNTANGYQALYANTTGFNNTANGYQALILNTTGAYNTANGLNALFANTTGSYNIALGYAAGYNITTGSQNIHIGNFGYSDDSNVIRIGSQGSQTKAYIAGISGVTASGGVQVFVNASGQLGTLTSSKRFKSGIKDIGSAGDKLMKLRPVTFRYKEAAENGTHPLQYGLIAEEVAKVYPELVQYDKDGKPFTVYYHLLTPLLLSELQKEHRQNASQQAELANFKQREIKQQAEFASLKQQFVVQQQQQTAQLAALQVKLNQLDRVVQASNSELRLSQK
ncbi:MAG: tail fiber domain-containing protein [Anaerolineae bacterium]|nr:tail fiber domain-containing protein [Gloeobacterales cyanobacterium ES-bin-313]